MPEENQQEVLVMRQPALATVPVTCPHCKQAFLHKIGHALKAAADAAVTIVLSNDGAFSEE